MADKETVDLKIVEGVPYDTKTGKEVKREYLNSHTKKFDFRVVDFEQDLATGIHINQYEKTAMKFLQDLINYSGESEDIFRQIDVSNKIYRHEDVAATGLEILIDFTITGYEFGELSDELKIVIDSWENNLNRRSDEFSMNGLKQFMIEVATEFFVSGNVYPAEVWEKTKIGDKTYVLPTRIPLLNPMHVRIDPNKFMNGQNLMFMQTSNFNKNTKNVQDLFEDTSIITNNNPLFNNGIKKSSIDTNFTALNSDLVSHIKRKSRSYDIYGLPYLTKLAQAITYKQKLWQLDLNTIDGLMNFITIFKIGSPDRESPFHKPSRSRLEAFASLLRSPQSSTALVWSHDIDLITAGPDGKVLNFNDKYKEANRAIIQGLGVPPILIDGSGTATAAFVTIIALNKRLEMVRAIVGNYIEHLILKIADRNKIEKTGKEKINWFLSDLHNETQTKKLLLAFYDRGLLPIKETHNLGGYRHEDMIEFKQEELDRGLNDLFARPDVPFSPSPDKTPGRPSVGPGVSNPSASLGSIGEFLNDKYIRDVGIVFDNLENDILSLKKKSKSQVDSLIESNFVRIEQLAETYASFDTEIDEVYINLIIGNASKKISNIRKDIKDTFNASVIKKTGTEKEFMFAGILSGYRKKVNEQASGTLRNIELALLLSKKAKDGFMTASVGDSCNKCISLNGESIGFTDLFKELITHDHSEFRLSFSKDYVNK